MLANLGRTRTAQHSKKTIATWYTSFKQSNVPGHLRLAVPRHDFPFGLNSRFRRTKFVRLLIAPKPPHACLLLSIPSTHHPRSLRHAVRPCRAAFPNRSLPSRRDRICSCSPARTRSHRLVPCCVDVRPRQQIARNDIWIVILHTPLSGRAFQKNPSRYAEISLNREHLRLQSAIIKISNVSSRSSTISKQKVLAHLDCFSTAALLLFAENVSLQSSGANPLWLPQPASSIIAPIFESWQT